MSLAQKVEYIEEMLPGWVTENICEADSPYYDGCESEIHDYPWEHDQQAFEFWLNDVQNELICWYQLYMEADKQEAGEEWGEIVELYLEACLRIMEVERSY